MKGPIHHGTIHIARDCVRRRAALGFAVSMPVFLLALTFVAAKVWTSSERESPAGQQPYILRSERPKARYAIASALWSPDPMYLRWVYLWVTLLVSSLYLLCCISTYVVDAYNACIARAYIQISLA